jgi:hypothetical protein
MLTGRHQQKLASLRTLLPERAWFLQNDGANLRRRMPSPSL